MKKLTKGLFVLTILVLLCSCAKSSKVARIGEAKISPEELAIKETIAPKLNWLMKNHNLLEDYLKKYRKYNELGNKGRANFYAKKYNGTMNRLVVFLTNLKEPEKGRLLVIPKSMVPLYESLLSFEKLRYSVRPNNLTSDDREKIKTRLENLCNADRELSKIWVGRTADNSYLNYTSNLTLEAGNLPFKLDITNGTVKIKASTRVGPFKATAQFGSGSRNGIRTLIVRNKHYERRFAIGGKPIQLEVPESFIETNGNIMIITAKS